MPAKGMSVAFISCYQMQFATSAQAGPAQYQSAETLTQQLTLPPNGYRVFIQIQIKSGGMLPRELVPAMRQQQMPEQRAQGQKL